jgi:hypothetical protein
MRFYWLQDRVEQKQFLIYWKPGHLNFADYFTKHHPASHHRKMRYKYLHNASNQNFTGEGVLLSPVCDDNRFNTILPVQYDSRAAIRIQE